jgi:hypothetical protein
MITLNKKLLIFGIFIFSAFQIPVAMAGFENCIYCHGSINVGIPYVNIIYLNSSMHGRLNNANDLNYACYACHWDGTPSKGHARSRSQIKTCEDCHTGNLFNAPQVSEHIPNGQDISTGASCISCHSNSVDTNAGYTGISDRVAHFGTTTNLMSPGIRSTNCTWCHFDNSGSADWGTPKDPRTSGTPLNHAPFDSSAQCYSCHVSGGSTPVTFHDSSLGKGGGKDCISCHDTGGIAPNVDFSASNDTRSVHFSLNSGSTTSLDRNNLRCWACHGDGDGSEASQPSGGHPLNYRTPKNCNNNDCHSISQSNFKEPMVYSHFQNAGKNNNPNNITNYNITVSVQCQVCHINSLVKEETNTGLVLVSHYGSKDKLVDSFNCIYCHLDEDNSQDWGDATLIQKNRTGLVKIDPEQNSFTVYEGEKVYLGEGYFLELVEIATARDFALIQLLKNDVIVDEVSLAIGTPYEYEREVTIDNTTLNIPDITIKITSMFKGSRGLIQFEGYRSRKIHTDKESKNSACFACHQYRYPGGKERYVIIDKEDKENYDDIYYTRVFVDMKSGNKNKIYIDNDDYIFAQLENFSGKYSPDPYKKKYLKEGETWNISDNYSLKLNEVSTDSEVALLTLTINGMIVESGPISKGHELKYTPDIEYRQFTQTNVTVFIANVTNVFQAKTNFILLEDVFAISPDIMKITSNLTLFGYNSSWFKINDTFATGRIPSDLHSPNQYEDTRNWADCVRCHESSKDLRIENFDAISSKLGKHSVLNLNASNMTFISDPIDKACWACHTGGTEPQMHSPTYTKPRECRSCHTSQKEQSYGAIYVGDEPHGNLSDCGSCHITDTHILKRFQVTPVVKRAVLSNNYLNQGDTIEIMAQTVAGYGMRIRAVEYFLDEKGHNGNGTPLNPKDGVFSSQNEEAQAQLNSTNISTGAHVLYIHAMERNNRWGELYPVNFTVVQNERGATPTPRLADLGVIYVLISIIVSYLFISGRGRR